MKEAAPNREVVLGSSADADTHREADRAVLAALKECIEVLALAEHPAFPDPIHHAEVKELGERIGFGALMSTASAGWRETLAAKGYPAGGEFVAGPCRATVQAVLAQARAAVEQARTASSVGTDDRNAGGSENQ